MSIVPNKLTCWADAFKPGVILWRGYLAFWSDFSATVSDFIWQKTARGNLMCRTTLSGSFIHEPEVFPATREHGYGIITFVEGEPPDNWTHLIVTGVGQGMTRAKDEPDKPNPGSCIFAKFAEPYQMTDYLNFRQRMARQYIGIANSSYEDKVKLILDTWPFGFRDTDQRLAINYEWTQGRMVATGYNIIRAAP